MDDDGSELRERAKFRVEGLAIRRHSREKKQ